MHSIVERIPPYTMSTCNITNTHRAALAPCDRNIPSSGINSGGDVLKSAPPLGDLLADLFGTLGVDGASTPPALPSPSSSPSAGLHELVQGVNDYPSPEGVSAIPDGTDWSSPEFLSIAPNVADFAHPDPLSLESSNFSPTAASARETTEYPSPEGVLAPLPDGVDWPSPKLFSLTPNAAQDLESNTVSSVPDASHPSRISSPCPAQSSTTNLSSADFGFQPVTTNHQHAFFQPVTRRGLKAATRRDSIVKAKLRRSKPCGHAYKTCNYKFCISDAIDQRRWQQLDRLNQIQQAENEYTEAEKEENREGQACSRHYVLEETIENNLQEGYQVKKEQDDAVDDVMDVDEETGSLDDLEYPTLAIGVSQSYIYDAPDIAMTEFVSVPDFKDPLFSAAMEVDSFSIANIPPSTLTTYSTPSIENANVVYPAFPTYSTPLRNAIPFNSSTEDTDRVCALINAGFITPLTELDEDGMDLWCDWLQQVDDGDIVMLDGTRPEFPLTPEPMIWRREYLWLPREPYQI